MTGRPYLKDRGSLEASLGRNELFIDLIIKPPQFIPLMTPFYVVARLIDPRDRHNVPTLINDGVCDRITARAVLFVAAGQILEGPVYRSRPLQPRDCVEMYSYNLNIGQDFRVGVISNSEDPPPGEYMVFKLCFSEKGTRHIRLELRWYRKGKTYSAWFITGEIDVGGPNGMPQWFTPQERYLLALLVPDAFPTVQEDPIVAHVHNLLREQHQQQQKQKQKEQ
ncbi:hypothetical protein E0Z10_g9706 [Xylaria hypoxylon]|uniref:Uncharacterized protein n=1 Tax=Xylaria hypoxylon TaxID=37992 RepID=A0A4Z0Y4Q9_9PEZI|nr:hypothetical protein E0Z10_g9706 [Xylaria hypoxylon]